MPSEAAIRRLDAFMKGGGTVIFDTRDAMNARPGAAPDAPRRSICAACSRRSTSPSSSRCRATTS